MPSWKKVIVSGSDASLNSINVATNVVAQSFSGSLLGTASYATNADFLDGKDSTVFATTGSNIFRGNQTVTGSLFTTGSNTLVGSTFLTGSLNITGSTTQIGNNTLLGNTLLSGSITISGSTAPGSPSASVQIYGDIRQSGYHRFDPVNANIDTSVSASYIYVSGSTQDLYFSQNGSGYSNVTRLRWLEGNLYTGLLHGGLITTQSSTVYQISSGSGIIVDLNASLSDDPYPTIQFLEWGNLSASIAPLTASYQQAFVGIDSTNNIYAQGTPFSNGQFDNIINVGNVLFQNQSTINGVKTQPSVAYGFEQSQNIFNRAFGPLKLSGYTLSPSGSSTGSLIVASGTAYAPGSNYSIDPNEPSYTVDSGTNVSKIFRYHQSGSTWVYNTNAGAGFTTIDPTQYSNNGVLTAVPGGGSNRQWSIQRAFYFPNSVTKAIVVYYGNATYATEVEAISNIPFESFVEAPNTAANAIYLGALVLRNDATFTDSATYKILAGGLFRQVGGSGGGGSTVTQTLAGLSDVNISGPTDGQALVYNTTQAKWINASAISASITGNAATATSASFATSASYAANGGVTQIIAGANITISPTNGLGQVTITSTGGSGSGGFNTATGSYGSFFDTTTQTASLANTPYPMRFNTTDVTNGVSISGSSNNFIKIANSGIYDLQFSAQLARSAGSGTEDVLIWLRKNGTDLSWTNTDVTFTGGSNVRQVAAWNWFLNAAAGDAYEIVWSTTSANIVIEANTTPNPDVPSVIATVARIDQFLSNTGSFSGSFEGQFTGSLFGTSSFATSASYSAFSTSASHAQNANTASYVLNAISASYAATASSADDFLVRGTLTAQTIVAQTITSSVEYITGSTQFGSLLTNTHQFTGSVSITGSLNAPIITGSLFGTASFAISASQAQNAVTASYVLNAVSASFASTASYVLNAVSASYALTSSNIEGGTQYYVPLWNTNTSLTSSYLNQSGSILKTTYNGSDQGLILNYNFNSFILGNENNTYLQVYDGGSTINIYSPNYTYFNDKVGIGIIPTNSGLAVSGALEITGPSTSKFMNSNVQITGSLNVTGGITGSLLGTASFATSALSSSYAITASYADFTTSASQAQNAVSSSFAITSSFTQNAVSASYAVTASILRNNTAEVSSSTAICTSGSTLLYDLSEFKGAMVDYVVSTSGSGNDIRGGTFTAVWNAVSSSSNEVTTMDIGNTDAVHFSADTTGSIFVNITTGTWIIDSLYRALGTAILAPTPTPSSTPTPTPSVTPLLTPSPSPSPTPTPSSTSLLTPTPSPTPSSSPALTPTPSLTPTSTPTPTSTSTPTPTPTPSATPVLYYTLNPCTGGDPLYDTTITPLIADQRYTDPSSGGRFWTWDNAAGTVSPQQTVRASMQIVSGQSSCPP